MPYSTAPSALNPPTTTELSREPTIQATIGPATNTGPMPGMTKKAAPNNIPQILTPEGTLLAPVLHALADGVISNNVVVGMMIPASDRRLLHVKSGPLRLLHRFLCLGVGIVNRYNRVRFRHDHTFLSLQIDCVAFPVSSMHAMEKTSGLAERRQHEVRRRAATQAALHHDWLVLAFPERV